MFQLLLATVSAAVALFNRTVTAYGWNVAPGSASATAIYDIDPSGNLLVNGAPVSGQWLVRGNVSDFEVRATPTGGTVWSGAAVNSWIACDVGAAWSLTANRSGASPGVTNVSGSALVEIRRKGTTAVLTSANVTISATAEVIQ